MPRFEPRVVQLSLPSEFGYEKVAMLSAGAIAENMGFSPARVQDLQTAVSEACLNAIEHAHRLRAGVKLVVTLRAGVEELQVNVVDRGGGSIPRGRRPHILEKVEGHEDSRGWGMFLIESLVDQVRVTTRRGGGKTLRLVLRLDGPRRSVYEQDSV
ncbi:MAG TPA: ATP-binding protein [Armatimonadota bacterium]|nr:ATP-binding protein [Armatimonadota bacterium]